MAEGIGKEMNGQLVLEPIEEEFLGSKEPGSPFLLRCYRHLREIGLFPRVGFKFGCDFLAYKTPNCDDTHAAYLVLCREQEVEIEELLALGRIAGAVGKKIACVTEAATGLIFTCLDRVGGIKG